MLDLRWIRAEPDALDQALNRRGAEPASVEILALAEVLPGEPLAFPATSKPVLA